MHLLWEFRCIIDVLLEGIMGLMVAGDFATTLLYCYCTALEQWARAKLCGVEDTAPPIFSRATITLGIGPHSSFSFFCQVLLVRHIHICTRHMMEIVVRRWQECVVDSLNHITIIFACLYVLPTLGCLYMKGYSDILFAGHLSSGEFKVLEWLCYCCVLGAVFCLFVHTFVVSVNVIFHPCGQKSSVIIPYFPSLRTEIYKHMYWYTIFRLQVLKFTVKFCYFLSLRVTVGHNRRGLKSGGLLCPFPWGEGEAGSPSNTMSPGLWHFDPSSRLATIHQGCWQTDRTMVLQHRANHYL